MTVRISTLRLVVIVNIIVRVLKCTLTDLPPGSLVNDVGALQGPAHLRYEVASDGGRAEKHG